MPSFSKSDMDAVSFFLQNQSAADRIAKQGKARGLLLDEHFLQKQQETVQTSKMKKLVELLSAASQVFLPDAVQKQVYQNDSGTHIIPGFIKKLFTKISLAFVVRPGTIDDVSRFVKWANDHNQNYTIRGAGTWPFGGAVPLNDDIVLDLSHLTFHKLFSETDTLAFGAGFLFPDARDFLKEQDYTLKQEITNPNSGTLAGWIVTGGLGLGSFKYGHVKESVKMLLVVNAQGELVSLQAGDEDFDLFFGSEGQAGIVVGGALKVRKESFVTKPYAFSFETTQDVKEYLKRLQDAQIKPTSVIYFDQNYIHETWKIEQDHSRGRSEDVLDLDDQKRLPELQEDKNTINELAECEHILVMHFDEHQDFQEALKTRLFSASGERIRIEQLVFKQLSTNLAHKLWEHRFLPVQMKQNGPSMLVSETILPFDSFIEYQKMLRPMLDRLLGVELKTEAHLLQNGKMLIQSIVLADTRTLRHKIYFAMVPLMTEVAMHFGAIPYGIGIWNQPFFKRLRSGNKKVIKKLEKYKKKHDPSGLINRSKFINSRGQKFFFRLFSSLAPGFNRWIVNTTHKRQRGKKWAISYPLERIAWNASAWLFPKIVPSDLKKTEKPLEHLLAPCAECDSCEHVCPTSDVFGLYGPATPITRRKTAERLVAGEQISQSEALGFLACTRCDNCVRVCPTDVPLTKIFDLVEEDNNFQNALGLQEKEKSEYVDRFWQIMKESPLYTDYTKSDQKEGRSHLQHGLQIVYPRGFEYGQLFIDPKTCIHCGMCSDENACMYGARKGQPRQIPDLLDLNCALCNACVNYCPQNKNAQEERDVLNNFIYNATDLEEKKYWLNRQNRIHDTTTVHRSTKLTEMADRYVTEDIIMEIDKEASSGQIPVSGMGQGDRHMGIGFDAERFAHFHIVGPAQNRLHEGDPEEELSVILGKRDSFCRFDKTGKLIENDHTNVKLMTPLLYNALSLESNGIAELAMIKTAEQQKSLVVVELNRIFQNYNTFLREGGYERLPEVLIPKVDEELIDQIQTNPRTNRDLLTDLWRMPAFEVEYHPDLSRTISYIRDSVKASGRKKPLIFGYLEVSEHDLIGSLSPTNQIKEKITFLLNQNIDVLHIHGRRNKEDYFVTSVAVRAIHHYLMRIGRRHEVSLVASGGIRLASDSQKTIQRGAEATLIDFAALLALDPSAYKAIKEDKATTEKLLSLDLEKAISRLNNQAESRKVQILEVLGASGFKDIKKTVGEEGRLIDFHQLENKLQRTVFENGELVQRYEQINKEQMANEKVAAKSIRRYSKLKEKIVPLDIPHNFYLLGDTNQTLYKRDYVWPGTLIENMGRMAAGDLGMLDFSKNMQTGLLGDGFDVMKILYNKDPMDVTEKELDKVVTALPMDKNLTLEAPWMFGGKSVGSIGLDTWRAHVVASRELGIQFDTGEGGYPTSIFLNPKGEPVFFEENEIELIVPFFENGYEYTVEDMRKILTQNKITTKSHPGIYEKIKLYPSLKPITFMVIIGKEDEPYVSTEIKTGLFGVSKQTIRKARRVVIAYSQGAKMGIGGHILAQKVNKLVSYLRGVEGLEELQTNPLEKLIDRLNHIAKAEDSQMADLAKDSLKVFDDTLASGEITDQLKDMIFKIQEKAYSLFNDSQLDEIDFENIISACEEIIKHTYSSIISPFPFHNCYSIEDVKAFIDVVHMINPTAVVSVKVSPSSDIEFIAAGLARISRDNTTEMIRAKYGEDALLQPSDELREYAKKHGMKMEIWLDGPRGGTGASPNIIKGQMGMHIEYAIPLIHNRLVRDGLRNNVTFMVSGGIRTYEDVVKSVALGADGVIWGTACLVTVGCDRNRNCHDGCSRGIATSNLTMQKLRDVENNTRQMINAFIMMQMQVIRALAALGMKDIRELRGRFDKIHWIGLKERVDHRFRIDKEIQKEILKDEELFVKRAEHATGQSNCGVAALNGTEPVPGYILDSALDAMRNRGMDGVGIAKTLCFPDYPNHYAYSIMVKGVFQKEIEENLRLQWQTTGNEYTETELRLEARKLTIYMRSQIIEKIKKVFLDPYFDFHGETRIELVRDSYKRDEQGNEMDYREFGNDQTDPGDIFRFFVKAKKEAVHNYIDKTLLKYDWSHFLEHQFPQITKENYMDSQDFLQKAEDLYVFDHSLNMTRILYTSEIIDSGFNDPRPDSLKSKDTVSMEDLLRIRKYANENPFELNKHLYKDRDQKIAAVMSCGKNFGTWKTAGRVIPWQTPDAPNNIIHVRLATGSVVEQMNSHPFAKLHTALTHNGETTNFEALKQRVEQFNLSPLASTDTEVAALKFHLIADEWAYPDWAVFESLSPTTGDDLALVDEKMRPQLESVQRVEFSSSPDGPYQYLCLRHDPYKNVTERVDIKDPADLRPNVTAFWKDHSKNKKRVFSMIASEEQAVHTMLKLLDKEGLIEGAAADMTLSSSGMISRYMYDEKSKIYDYDFKDRYGQSIELQEFGQHFSVRHAKLTEPERDFSGWERKYRIFITKELEKISFNDFHWLLFKLVENADTQLRFKKHLDILTWLRDSIKTLNPGTKAISSLTDMVDYFLEKILDRVSTGEFKNYYYYSLHRGGLFDENAGKNVTLVINAEGFLPEGSDPDHVLAAFLNQAYDLGWRQFIIYRVHGQRLISTAVMGKGDTDDVEMDVYGSAGEYFGAFMQGGTIRMHGNAQNFAAMCMHHGNLYIYGNAGKVCGYGSKGGKVFIMGNVVDRVWTNSVNDSRTQQLDVLILGSATKYAGESLMGGNFFFGGMHFNEKGQLCLNDRPYLGTKMLGGASRGKFVFFDPENRLLEAQYTHGKIEEFSDEEWAYFEEKIREVFELSNIPVYKKNSGEYINVDGKMVEFSRDVFKLIIPKGGLKGYESH
ncbi:MAG: FAD-binding protein [Calditrichaeota bacterium]|nr:MAG: FAD-binding protein [Calditrichota bacterium]MBL1205918.1 FAD-binding protein [Calditrichota bacterium]NOG45746.1 FAD-binding protein [Calditrichota bacterium]